MRALFDNQGLSAVQALPVHAGLRPRLMALDEAALLLARIAPVAPRLGFACGDSSCSALDNAPEEDAGSGRLLVGGH